MNQHPWPVLGDLQPSFSVRHKPLKRVVDAHLHYYLVVASVSERHTNLKSPRPWTLRNGRDAVRESGSNRAATKLEQRVSRDCVRPFALAFELARLRL